MKIDLYNFFLIIYIRKLTLSIADLKYFLFEITSLLKHFG